MANPQNNRFGTADMHFEGERHSAWFRRTLAALDTRHGEPAVRQRLGTLCSRVLSEAAIAALIEREQSLGSRIGGGADNLDSAGGTEAAGAQAEAALGAALRRARNWLLLALIERDTTGAASLEEVCTAMSAFAQQATALAMRTAAATLVARHGTALDPYGRPQDLLAVGMGKVGGRELNVSSDLDLVFVFRGEGECRGAGNREHPEPGGTTLATSEWMHLLARRTIALLATRDADGFVFRVDVRLRPHGASGPLVASLPTLEQYFYAQGREWERFAWLKGRVIADSGVAGDKARAADETALARIVDPFVYRRYLDFDAIEALHALHARIRAEVTRRDLGNPRARDVKLGRGGIREIEFIAQLFQIVRGGQDPTLRSRSTLETLATLARKGLLPEDESVALADAYRLLRRTEHMLQYREDAQTHRLARSGAERKAIAAMLGLADEAFVQAVDDCTERTARIFDRLLAPAHADDLRPAQAGAAPPDPEALRRFAVLRESKRYRAARADTRAAIERLLDDAIGRGTGTAGLTRLADLLETICRRPGYVALLDRFRGAFARVLRVLDWAQWPAGYLMQHPVVLDELLDGELLEPQDYRLWSDELQTRLHALPGTGEHGGPDVERQMDLVREAYHAQVFRLMMQDLEGRLSVEHLSDHLSELADRVLDLVIPLVWSQLRLRFRDAPRFAAIAYGRLGGKELGYVSDIDLVFLYDDDDDRAPEAYALLAQRVAAWLSTRTAAGLLFETDLRLRPNGSSGLLVSRLAAFETYQNEAAWVWEHQALTRARFCAGDPSIGEHFESIRRRVLAHPRDLATLRREIHAMRARIREYHDRRKSAEPATLIDLKHGAGGMIDLEFVVQYLVLAYAGKHPELLDNAGNIALLGRAAALGLVDEALARRGADAYRRYRRLQHQARLDGVGARVDPESIREEREAVLLLQDRLLGADHDV